MASATATRAASTTGSGDRGGRAVVVPGVPVGGTATNVMEGPSRRGGPSSRAPPGIGSSVALPVRWGLAPRGRLGAAATDEARCRAMAGGEADLDGTEERGRRDAGQRRHWWRLSA